MDPWTPPLQNVSCQLMYSITQKKGQWGWGFCKNAVTQVDLFQDDSSKLLSSTCICKNGWCSAHLYTPYLKSTPDFHVYIYIHIRISVSISIDASQLWGIQAEWKLPNQIQQSRKTMTPKMFAFFCGSKWGKFNKLNICGSYIFPNKSLLSSPSTKVWGNWASHCVTKIHQTGTVYVKVLVSPTWI